MDNLLSDDSVEQRGKRSIEINAQPSLHFDGESRESIEVNASLIDGFVYRMPFHFSVKEGITLNDLYGQTICQCASLQLERGRVGGDSDNVEGAIFLRPNKVRLEQTLRLFGTLPGASEAIEVGRVKVGCKVFAPLRVQPSWIEVSEAKPFPETITVELSQGVVVLDAKMSAGRSLIAGNFEKDDSIFRLEFPETETVEEKDWLSRDGNLTFQFELEYMGMRSSYEVIVPYGPPRPTRVAPEDIVFRTNSDTHTYLGRLFVLGLRSTEQPNLTIEYCDGENNWARANVDFIINEFSRGRASGHIEFPRETTVLSKKTKRQLRLVDKETGVPIANFTGSLAELF